MKIKYKMLIKWKRHISSYLKFPRKNGIIPEKTIHKNSQENLKN